MGSISVTNTSISTNLLTGPTIVAITLIVLPGAIVIVPIRPFVKRIKGFVKGDGHNSQYQSYPY